MDKKNTLLLTVIAVATLLVAVVGATFAYFTAQVGDGAKTPIKVTTSTSDTLVFGTWDPIEILATQQNFGPTDAEENPGSSQYDVTGGSVTLKATDATDDAGQALTSTYCYNAYVKFALPETIQVEVAVEGSTETTTQDVVNHFVYTTEDQQPELTMLVVKNGTALLGTVETLDEDGKIVTADNNPSNDYDITTITQTTESSGNVEVINETDENYTYVVKLNFPTVAGGTDYDHIITATTGQEVSDAWEVLVTMINLDHDQQANTGKQLNASLVFSACPTTTD